MRPPPDWKGVNAMAEKTKDPKPSEPKKPGKLSRFAHALGEAIGQAKFGQ